jgi:glyoxylase-like metal-dependent hydrolase (beta-lactamase superfamily II)
MIVKSNSNNVFSVTSGEWRVWSLSDGYLDMPADLLRDPEGNPVP